jgi:hypothetical protein
MLQTRSGMAIAIPDQTGCPSVLSKRWNATCGRLGGGASGDGSRSAGVPGGHAPPRGAYTLAIATLVVAALCGGCTPETGAETQASLRSQPQQAVARPQPLVDAAPSLDALLDQFVDAVQRNDESALHALRVTEAEYTGIIVPWTVPAGQPQRQVPEQSTRFYWTLLDAKSRDLVRLLLDQHGGKKLRRTTAEYTKGVQTYGGYTAYGQLRLHVLDEEGKDVLLRAGTIAEVNGQYKFIGLNWND